MIFGISTLWWKYTHNQHHVVVNEYDIDPDITHLPFFAVNKVIQKISKNLISYH